MKNSLRTLMAVVVGSVGLLVTSSVEAANPATISVTVTIRNLSVAVADGTIAFGPVDAGSNTVNAEKQVVTNDGNVSETYTLRLTTTDVYTAGTTKTAAGVNTYVLQALFQASAGAAPASADFGADVGAADDVVLSASAQIASATVYGFAAGTGTGASVPAAGVRDLYFKYSAPTSATTFAEENLIVTVTATAA